MSENTEEAQGNSLADCSAKAAAQVQIFFPGFVLTPVNTSFLISTQIPQELDVLLLQSSCPPNDLAFWQSQGCYVAYGTVLSLLCLPDHCVPFLMPLFYGVGQHEYNC